MVIASAGSAAVVEPGHTAIPQLLPEVAHARLHPK